jgi:iron(III) transport system substrate-binding protein
MPNPASSGTGFFDVTAWLTLWGDQTGRAGVGSTWTRCTRTSPSTRTRAPSPATWLRRRVRGRHLVRVPRQRNKAKGAPIDLVFPKEGLGWDLEAFAIHKGTKKLEAAKKLADWASSKDAMLLYGKNFAITAQPGVAGAARQRAGDYEKRLVKMDFKTAAENRERVLAEWTRRYDSKSEPKK